LAKLGDFSVEFPSRVIFGGKFDGEICTLVAGEGGAGGGGGGLILSKGSFPSLFPSNDRLFRPCSKNLDFTLPLGFCHTRRANFNRY
jgi:hypothetical protein